MKVYTSYFARQAKLMNEGRFVLVSIARAGAPKWFTKDVVVYNKIAPSWDLVSDIKSGAIDWAEYTRRYLEEVQFDKRKLEYVHDLINISNRNGGKDLILMCFEKPGDNCHRHIVAKHMGFLEM